MQKLKLNVSGFNLISHYHKNYSGKFFQLFEGQV